MLGPVLTHFGSKGCHAGGGGGDKRPLLKKCSHGTRTSIASDNQVQLLAFSCGLVFKPGGTVLY